MSYDSDELKEGDMCVAAIFPLQHIWQVGVITQITEHRTFKVDCGDKLTEKLTLAPHEVRPAPEGVERGDRFNGDIHKHSDLNQFEKTTVTVWVAKDHNGDVRVAK